MAARALMRKINGNRQAISINGVFQPCRGIDRGTTRCCSVSSGTVRRTTEDRGYVELWNNKLQVVEHQKLLLPCFELWNNKLGVEHQRPYLPWFKDNQRLPEIVGETDSELEVEQQRLLLHEVQVQGWMANFTGSLLSIQNHHHGSGGEGILKFTTSTPQRGLVNVQELSFQRPGPYNIQRQAVEGVVCITTKDAFLLYNPTTGNTSPWIETTASREGRQIESIALGYDPKSKKHKVICISTYVTAPDTTTTATSKYLVVEVLNVGNRTWTTGQHKWRRLKDCDELPAVFSRGNRFVFLDGPVYLDGKIHWLFHRRRSFEYILEFNVTKETFLYTPASKKIRWEFLDSTRQIRAMLVVVDGKIAILMSKSDQKTSSLWICHLKPGGNRYGWLDIEWTTEEVLIPYASVCPSSSIEALAGTNLIFTQSNGRSTYYNRKMKVSLTSPISDHLDRGRIVQM